MKAEYNISKTVGHDDWRGMRLTLEGREGETEKQLMDRVADEVDSWFANRYNAPIVAAAPHQIPEIPVEKPIPEDQRVRSLIDDINSCTELKVLETYRLLAKKDAALQAAYDVMLKKLTP